MGNHNLPKEPGLYWASEHPVLDEWELIARVSGQLPFLRCKAWKYYNDTMSEYYKPEELFFGLRIDSPKRDPNEGYL